MTITFPRSLPTMRGFSRWEWINKDSIAQTRSEFSQVTRSYDWMGNALMIAAEVILARDTEDRDFSAFVTAMKGTHGTFTMGPPSGLGNTPRGIGTGTPLVNGANQTGASIITDGWTAGQTGILKAWDWMQIESRLYAVLADANSDGSGNATFDIWPPLRKSPANNATITVTNPTGTWRMMSRPTIPIDETPYVRVPFTAIEDVTFT
jgi:hypothetical protein